MPVNNEKPNVHNAVCNEKRPVREVQETHTVTFDELEGDANVMAVHAQAIQTRAGNRPPPPPSRPMEPKTEVVTPVVITLEERRVEEWLAAKKNRAPAAELEIEMP